MPNLFDDALAAEGVTGKLADLARSIYTQESGGGKNTQTSNQGAVGGMQIIPGTFNSVADKGWSIDNPEHNVRAGIRYISQMFKQAGGDPALAAAGYYGGPGGLEKARQGVAVSDPKNPKAPNTLQYGAQVVARMGAPKAEVATPVRTAAASPAQSFPVGAVAPVADPQPDPVQEVVAAAPVAQEATVVAGGNTGPDAWQAFLRSMPQGSAPDQVASFKGYGRPSNRQPMAVPGSTVQSRRPNFEAFSSWVSPLSRRA